MFSSLLLVVFFVHNASSVCDRNTGPSGSYDCFLGTPQYTEYQWGTCLSDAYIKQSSSGQYQCADQTRVYCYYQCMLDLYKIVNGPVYDACACNPNSSVTASPMSTLAPTCYSPTGEDCSWYTNCLAERYPCTGSDAEYAISYGYHFCTMYTERSYLFNATALAWIGAVRKCLQISLVPLIRDFRNITCEELQQRAYDSHVGCYVKPYQGYSVCTLNPYDFLQIFWTVKTAFKSQFLSTFSQFLQTGFRCGLKYTSAPETKYVKMIYFEISIYFPRNITNRSRRSTVLSNDEITFNVMKSISNQLSWDRYPIDWYSYTTNSSFENSTNWNFMLLIADTNGLGLTNKTTNLNISNAVDTLSSAINKGDIQVSLPDQLNAVFVGSFLGNCPEFQNSECHTVQKIATLPADFKLKTNINNPSKSVKSINLSNNMILLFCVIALIVRNFK